MLKACAWAFYNTAVQSRDENSINNHWVRSGFPRKGQMFRSTCTWQKCYSVFTIFIHWNSASLLSLGKNTVHLSMFLAADLPFLPFSSTGICCSCLAHSHSQQVRLQLSLTGNCSGNPLFLHCLYQGTVLGWSVDAHLVSALKEHI